MKQYRLVGDSFSHLTGGNKGYMSHGQVSQYIEWVREGDETFYIDDNILSAFNDTSRKKYAVIMETPWLTQHLIDDVKNRLSEYMEVFDYIFTWSDELCKLHERIVWIPLGSWIKQPQIYPKNKLVSIIASRKMIFPGHIDRLNLLTSMHDHVPIFGRGFQELEYKEEGLADYMFSVAIENSTEYFTEKLLDVILCGAVPIYHGHKNIQNYFNMDGIILINDDFDITQLTEEMYHERRDAIQDNFNRALEMVVPEDYMWLNYLQ